MYFSDREDVVFINRFGCILTAKGPEGFTLLETDFPNFPWGFDATEYTSLEIAPGFVRVEPGFLAHFTSMEELILGPTVKDLELTAAMKKQLRKQKVLMRGRFGGPAEQTAKELTLKFRHADIFLADHIDEEHHEYSKLTLCFSDEGPYLLEDVITPGWAASNNGGGEVRTELPADFYKDETPDSFAERFGERFWEQIRTNEELAPFLEEANRRIKK